MAIIIEVVILSSEAALISLNLMAFNFLLEEHGSLMVSRCRWI